MSDTAETGMVVLLSGGLDSSVLLHHPRRQVVIETPVHVLRFITANGMRGS